VFALWADVPCHPLRWPSPGITSGDVLTAADAQRFRARYRASRVLAEVIRRGATSKGAPGPGLLRGPGRHISPVLVPWADVERIILYRGPATRGLAVGDGPCVGIQRRPGARRLRE
jgi:hypothetical protein